ncbi:SDR family oxidoreductase [candidate division KSB1 bacterium]|nr:SDR family oxidoreductase [candidate division KSB1 bacterium]
MDFGLKNKVALVAASSRGLGKAIAWALAREGTKLVICARNKEVLEKTADEILLQTGVTVFPLALDLTNREQIDWLMTETLDLFGGVDILITNNGGPPPGTSEDVDEDDWQHAIQTTLMSAVRLSKAVIPGMQKKKWGRIIHLASITAKQPIPRLFLSNVLRPAVVGLAKCQSQDYAADNILVNAICPGYFMTERVGNLLNDREKKSGQSAAEVLTDAVSEIPLGRIGDPEELANLVTFLDSEKASYITGSNIVIDGGYDKGLM